MSESISATCWQWSHQSDNWLGSANSLDTCLGIPECNAGDIEFYKDGVLDDTALALYWSFQQRITVACRWIQVRQASPLWLFDGKMDDIRAYEPCPNPSRDHTPSDEPGRSGAARRGHALQPIQNARIYKQLSAEAQMTRPATLKIGATSYWTIMTYTDAGVLVDADSTPTVAVRKNGVANADVVVVTKRATTTGIYDAYYNPAGEAEGDCFTLEETATISAQAYENAWNMEVLGR